MVKTSRPRQAPSRTGSRPARARDPTLAPTPRAATPASPNAPAAPTAPIGPACAPCSSARPTS
eukprot:14076664-Alexandrium_andersonii.AAC.1